MLACAGIALLALSLVRPHADHPLGSVEVKYADRSEHGLAIVPASCPSTPDYPGQCGSYAQSSYTNGYSQGSYYSQASYAKTCTPSVVCSTGTSVRIVSASCSVRTVACPDGWSCSSGACIPPPDPSFVTFTGSAPNGGGSFTATGHLQARPTLVRSGSPTYLYWSVENVSSCTVSDGNGNTWSGSSSPAAGQASMPLAGRTTFTLDCTPLRGSSATVHESVVVNVAPSFQEQ